MNVERKPTRYAHSDGHTDVCYSQSGDKLITCGTDGDIRIWSGFDDDDPIQTCVGEWSLCVQHNNDNLYVATNNYTVQILTYPDGQRSGILRTFAAPVNHMVISNDKKFILLGCEDAQLKMINLEDNNEEFNFEGINGAPLSVAICPNSKYVAVTSGDTFLRIWNVDDQKLLYEQNCVPKTNSFMNAKVLCRIDFDRLGQCLAYPDKNTVKILNIKEKESKYTLDCDAVNGTYSLVKYSPCGNYIAAASTSGDVVIWDVANTTVSSYTTHSKSIGICALVWNPAGNGEIAYCDVEGQLGIVTKCIIDVEEETENNFIDDECSVDMNDDKVENDDDDVDNENAISLEKLKKDILGDESEDEKDDARSHVTTPRPKTPEIPMQDCFMPSSTPTHLDPRYMCWNDVAVIRCYGSSLDDDVETGKHIEVEFHDYSFHNSMMMQNYHGYFLGSVSTTALAVANTSQISVVPLTASSKEWNLSVDEGDEIVCIACTKNFIGVGTSNYFVRICSIYGVQRAIFGVPGPIVSMAGFNNSLLVAFHSGSVRKSDQSIKIMFVKLDGFSINCSELCTSLRPEAHLQWIGFTDVGTPAMMDSTGVLSIYPLKSNVWIPICDTTKLSKSPADGFFVTVVYETLQTVRGIICKGSMYPGFTPRPTQSEHPIRPLFLELSTERVSYEASLFMSSIIDVNDTEKKFKETGLKAFALACKNNLEERALELIEMFQNQQLLSLAIKYATRLDKRRLVERLNSLSEYSSQEESSFATPPIKVNRRLTLGSSSKTSSDSKSNTKKNVVTPSEKSRVLSEIGSSNTSTCNPTINTQESLFSQEKASPGNPFAIKKQTTTNSYNPMSLTDKSAGIHVKDNKTDNEGDKRKRGDNDNEENKEKQRKLNPFLLKKN